LPNVGPYIYDVSISGFTRSSIYIYIYDISSLRVKPLWVPPGFLPSRSETIHAIISFRLGMGAVLFVHCDVMNKLFYSLDSRPQALKMDDLRKCSSMQSLTQQEIRVELSSHLKQKERHFPLRLPSF